MAVCTCHAPTDTACTCPHEVYRYRDNQPERPIAQCDSARDAGAVAAALALTETDPLVYYRVHPPAFVA